MLTPRQRALLQGRRLYAPLGISGRVRRATKAQRLAIPDSVVFLPESGDLDHFSGDKSDFELQTTTTIGSEDLTLRGERPGSGNRTIISTSGLSDYPEVGQRLRVNTQIEREDSSTETISQTLFGVQDSSNHYGVAIDGANGFQIRKDFSVLSETSYSFDYDTEYVIIWDWTTTEPEIEAELYTPDQDFENDDPLATVSASDTEYTSGGIGFDADIALSPEPGISFWSDYNIREQL